MAATGTITIIGSVTGLASGTKTISGTISSSAAVGTISDTVLASGANTITVPSGATAVVIQPPSGNTILVTFKGVSGDTGVALHKTQPSVIALDSSVTSFVLTAASGFSSATEISFV